MDYRREYGRWLENLGAAEDGAAPEEAAELRAELEAMDDAAVEDAFYRELTFGTGGLRGTIGAGTNRMNVYVVGKATQGLANYLKKHFKDPSVVIGYDSRLKSEVFALEAAGVFAANGIKVHAWRVLLPVPTVSYAVRRLGASGGVMITASHNPSKYNGYKVFGPDGCQITTEAAEEVLGEISATDIFTGVTRMHWEDALTREKMDFIPEEILTEFIGEVRARSVLFGDRIDRDVAIVYTPLNGTGLKPVTRVLGESGFTKISIVEEQREPDGHFPTCPYPNPEIREAMALGIEYCERTGADLLLATDPDCDRCGIAVKDGEGYRLLSGNEVGLLLLDYICSQRVSHGEMPAHPVFVKTIVTSDLAGKIAEHYGVETVNVLTGFKYIGEVIGRLEAEGREDDFLLGFEESYGYLSGTYVRDKDAVNAAFLICEMFAFYRTRGVSLVEKLDELYRSYGYCLNTLHSFQFEGSAGMAVMDGIMKDLRAGLDTVGGAEVLRTEDYLPGLGSLPPADVLKYYTADGSVVVRPSGTEPKLKLYVSVTAKDRAAAEKKEKKIAEELAARMK